MQHSQPTLSHGVVRSMNSSADPPETPLHPAVKAQKKPLWVRKRSLLIALLLLIFGVGWGGFQGRRWLQERQFRQQCEEARRSEDWRTERSAAKAWATQNPASGEAWWFAAEAAQELEDPEDIAFCLGQITPQDPKAIFAYVEKANLEWTILNQPLQAVATSQKVLALDPKVTEIQSRLISFYAMSLQRAELIRAIRSAVAAQGEPREAYVYLLMSDNISFSNGADLNSRWLASSPDEVRFKVALGVNTAASIVRSADATSSEKVAELEQEAERQLQWFLDSIPHDTVLLTYLMNRSYEAGNVARVGELLQNVDESGIDDHMVWVYRGWYHIQMNELPQAQEAIEEALRLNPLSGLARHEYARLLRLQQKPAAEVAQQQQLAAAGKEIRAKLLLQTNVREVPWEFFGQIARYAADCGDQLIAENLYRRIGSEPGQPVPVSNRWRKLQADVEPQPE